MTAAVTAAVPYAIGDRVMLWGKPGRVAALARSLATERTIVTVTFDEGLSLRAEIDAVQAIIDTEGSQ